ncbi:Kdo domain containing protein [Flavobacterium sp.]|uniref:Kdo domain containing protein n=1 Tax=Flavobacterium sp. TaxID=239 RepID=UPI0025C5B0A4|nr:Kdo domain containing protein [Flavobacterium sp.]MBA4153964.1 Kdo domain containing protein [Flavobacterium sp.]
MDFKINSKLDFPESILLGFIKNFTTEGKILSDGTRNCIKIFSWQNRSVAIKSFKIPNFYNAVIYRYFRKSKAKRSFEYAIFLSENNIGTPAPIAYFENFSFLGLKDSYYVSENLECDLTFRELVKIPDFPEHEAILRQFTQFCFQLHEKGIEFKDHSPGNTLIKKNEQGLYDFFLVDLNRMNFHEKMPFELRMKNLCRLTPKQEMILVMSNEYAKVSGESEKLIFETLWKYTSEFQYRFFRKKRLKKKFLFWK